MCVGAVRVHYAVRFRLAVRVLFEVRVHCAMGYIARCVFDEHGAGRVHCAVYVHFAVRVHCAVCVHCAGRMRLSDFND